MRGLEEAMGAASLGLGGVHREVGVLDQLVEFGAVLRRQRDADAGVGREMMAEALIGLPDRLVDAGHEFLDVGAAADRGLDHREFVAAEAGDQVARLDAVLEAGRDRLQKLVADMMSERVVDALEFVDVDIEQRELLAADGLAEARARSVRGTAPGSAGRSARRNARDARSSRRRAGAR